MSIKDPVKRKKYHDDYSRKWYKNRSDKHKKMQYKYRNKRRLENLEFINSQKDVPCLDCGKKFPPYVMHFDHLPGTIKIASVSLMRSWGLEKIKAEIAKCEVVCANCHAIRTYKRWHTPEA